MAQHRNSVVVATETATWQRHQDPMHYATQCSIASSSTRALGGRRSTARWMRVGIRHAILGWLLKSIGGNSGGSNMWHWQWLGAVFKKLQPSTDPFPAGPSTVSWRKSASYSPLSAWQAGMRMMLQQVHVGRVECLVNLQLCCLDLSMPAGQCCPTHGDCT